MSATSSSPWRSRITGQGAEDPTQLLANPANWRVHPGGQRDALRGSLDTVGWVQQVMVNTVTGHVVDGHARVEEAISRGEPTVPVLYVELTQEEEDVVLATLDPISALATADPERLQELLAGIAVDDRGLQALLRDLAASINPDDRYTPAVNIPLYEITGERPPVEALTDTSRADELSREILATPDLDPAVRDFLLAATRRHVVFDYRKIAEWYAGAEPTVQRLVEASALVIIDLDDAIRLGYVRVSDLLDELREHDA